jgi:hypothetical protein
MSKVVKKVANVIGLGAPEIKIPGPSASQMQAAQLQANLSQDLGLENVPVVETGGTTTSTDTLGKKKKITGSGLSSSLGL